jgi:hypothetical protein
MSSIENTFPIDISICEAGIGENVIEQYRPASYRIVAALRMDAMSTLGQSRSSRSNRAASALPRETDMSSDKPVGPRCAATGTDSAKQKEPLGDECRGV